MKGGGNDPIWALLGNLYKAHPWHGVAIGDGAPDVVTTYIEVVPTDTVKYELDKLSGFLKVDRPQKFSNICPTLYGLIPQTYCGEKVGELCEEKTGRKGIVGDDDPLDVCVLTEKTISRGDLFLQAIPIGGLRMIDGDEADDKIVAVLKDDAVYGGIEDIANCPPKLIERMKHYFLTYKEIPGESEKRVCEIAAVYGREEAHDVIRRSQEDYHVRFGNLEELLTAALRS